MKIKMNYFMVFSLLTSIFVSTGAFSQSESSITSSPTKRKLKIIQYKKKTTINLDESAIEADINDFSQLDVTVSTEKGFKNPIDFREHFLKEFRDETLYSR